MKVPTTLSITLAIACVGIWGLLMVMSMAFVIYDQPLSIDDDKFLLYSLIKYYPILVIGTLAIALKFKDNKGLLPFSAAIVPTSLVGFLIFDMTRVSIIDWDSFETPSEQQFIYQSAFGAPDDLAKLRSSIDSLNFTGEAGLSPLLAAYRARNMETFTYLLEQGANTNLMPYDSLQYHVGNYIINDRDQRQSQQFFEQLTHYGLDIHVATSHSNLLDSASTNSNQWYLVYLLENGASANIKGSIYLTPIAYATLHGYWENALYLIPYSDSDGLYNAAAILYEGKQLGIYNIPSAAREAFETSLTNHGIDFQVAYDARRRQ